MVQRMVCIYAIQRKLCDHDKESRMRSRYSKWYVIMPSQRSMQEGIISLASIAKHNNFQRYMM